PTNNPADPFDGDHDQTSYVMASFSTDGGKSWSLFYDGTSNYNLADPAVMPSTGNPYPALARADSPSVAIDRVGGLYLVYDEHNAGYTSGFIDLQKFDFSGATPAALPGLNPEFSPFGVYQV